MGSYDALTFQSYINFVCLLLLIHLGLIFYYFLYVCDNFSLLYFYFLNTFFAFIFMSAISHCHCCHLPSGIMSHPAMFLLWMLLFYYLFTEFEERGVFVSQIIQKKDSGLNEPWCCKTLQCIHINSVAL